MKEISDTGRREFPHDRADYLIKTSPVPVRCFICDVRIMPGEIHVSRENERICLMYGLPARRLRPMGINAMNTTALDGLNKIQ